MPTPEEQTREIIDQKLTTANWVVQDFKQLNVGAGAQKASRVHEELTREYGTLIQSLQADSSRFTDGRKAAATILDSCPRIDLLINNAGLVTDSQGGMHAYQKLIRAADQKALYRYIDSEGLVDSKIKTAIADRRELIANKIGNDSVFTLFIGLDLDPSCFSCIASEYFFFTPSRAGQTAAGLIPVDGDRAAIEKWMVKFFALTTYEISCPVLRDADHQKPE